MPDTHSIQSADLSNPPRAARPEARPEPRPVGQGDVDALWTVRDVSAYLRVPVSSIYKMTATHASVRIPHIHIGAALRFRRTDVDRWLSLLTISNMDTLARMREHLTKVTHGHDP